MLLPDAIFELNIHQNGYAAGALPLDPTGGLPSPRLPNYLPWLSVFPRIVGV